MLGYAAASRAAPLGSLSTSLVGGGGGGGRKRQSFAEAAGGLRELLIDASTNELVRDGFKKPSEIIGFLEALVSAVAHEVADEDDADAQAGDNWERLYAALAPSQTGAAGLFDRLFDCLEALAPCQNCPCADRRELPVDEVLLGSAERRHTLCVDGLSCFELRGEGRVDPRVALAEAIQRQVQILNLVAGISRISWRLAAWANPEPAPTGRPAKPRIPHWHATLGPLKRACTQPDFPASTRFR